MKVILVNNFASNTGAGRYAFSLFKNLRKYIDVDIICTYAFKNVGNNQQNILFLTKLGYSPVANAVNYFLNHMRVPRGYDIYHIASQSLGRFSRFLQPSVITIHDLIPLRIEVSPYKSRILRKFYIHFANKSIRDSVHANMIISPSYFTKKEIIELLKVNPNKVIVIPYGLDHGLFRPRDKERTRKMLGLPLNKKLILSVANEDALRKNIRTLILAFSKLRKRLSDVILVRVGKKSSYIQDLIAKLKLQECIFNVGEVPADRIAYFYNACDLFVFPSLYEGFGIPPLEAIASGCPVIASNMSSIPEVVGDAGVLLDPLDVDGFAYSMLELLSNDSLRSEFVKKGLARSKIFSWEKCARRTMEVYKRIIDY